MSKKMLIDATHEEETRVVVVDGNKVEEFDFEAEAKRQLAGNIYLAKVTRVEPSLQAAFIEYGGNRHGFLAFGEIHPDYYQIPVADREALLAEEQAEAEEAARAAEEAEKKDTKSRRRRRKPAMAEADADDVTTAEPEAPEDGEAPSEPAGMETVEPETVDAPETETSASDDAPEAEESDAEAPEAPEEAGASDDEEDVRPRRKPRPKRYKIQEVIKVRQIMLVQVVKEERGNKGAALTTYLSLAGRYCVLMPNTARGGGISRKITNAADRKKLKEIAQSIDVPKGAGLIVRTAGANRTKTEIKRDYEYLQRLWEQVRELTLKSIAPAKIYEEGNLIKRSIRDLYSRDIEEVLVEGEEGYRTAKDFMKMIMPSHAKNVKRYGEQLPLFARYQVESYLAAMFNPTVQLKSGGYIVIGVTEALVAVDVNSGRATKEGSIEETALKTNLEAAEEVARQAKLRDLAGLIVIDFIDMDERRNNAAVEKRLKEKLKSDRARIQVGRISSFGLLEMSRQRLRPGMLEASTQPCPSCQGTGLIRSDESLALSIIRQLEEEGVRRRSREVLLKAPVDVINYLFNHKREHIANIEARYGLSIRLEGDPHMVSPDVSIEKFKTQTRKVEATAPVVSGSSELMDEVDEAEVIEEEASEAVEERSEDEEKPKKKRRRSRGRRRRGGGDREGQQENGEQQAEAGAEREVTEDAKNEGDASGEAEADAVPASEEEKPKRKVSRSRSRSRKAAPSPELVATQEVADGGDEPAREADPAPMAQEETLTPDVAEAITEDAGPAEAAEVPESVVEAEKSADHDGEAAARVASAEPEPTPEPEPEPAMAEAEAEPEAPKKPKRRGWWSLGR